MPKPAEVLSNCGSPHSPRVIKEVLPLSVTLAGFSRVTCGFTAAPSPPTGASSRVRGHCPVFFSAETRVSSMWPNKRNKIYTQTHSTHGTPEGLPAFPVIVGVFWLPLVRWASLSTTPMSVLLALETFVFQGNNSLVVLSSVCDVTVMVLGWLRDTSGFVRA